MRSMTITTLLIAGSILGSAANVRADDRTGVLVGVDARDRSYYGYVGVTQHFGKSIVDDGIIARVVGFAGQYQYSTPAVSQGKVDADYSALEALVGYQKVLSAVTLRGYVGFDYEAHHLSPNNIYDGNRGSHFGAKLRGEVETDFASPNYGDLIAIYGTARERYWVRGRAGRDFSGYVVGPEVIASGDKEAHEERLGVFLNFRNLLPATLSISAGEAKSGRTSAGYTPYVTLEVTSSF